MKAQHRHYCACDNFKTCTREDCELVGWECDECADQHMSEYFQACGDQPRLPMDDPALAPMEMH